MKTKKTARDNIIEFLEKEYPAMFPSAQLERMIFKNADGTTAQPKSIRNRLQDLQREEYISVEYHNKNEAWYQWNKQADEKRHAPKFRYEPTADGGMREIPL